MLLFYKKEQIATFSEKAATARDSVNIPVNIIEEIARTKMIVGKESTTIEFMAPSSGEYDLSVLYLNILPL